MQMANRRRNPGVLIMPSFLKTQYYRSPKMLKAMRLFPCSHCGVEDGTIIGAHLNSAWAGKGRGIKASDIVAALCAQCHSDCDNFRGEWALDPDLLQLKAVFQTMVFGFENGIFKVAK